MALHALAIATPLGTSELVDDTARGARTRLLYWLLLGGVMVTGALFLFWHLGRGFVPHDDGAIGQAAERVLRGELPHRDFDDVYTGGLAWLNAWGFRLFGISAWSMRLVLLMAFVLWIPAVYYIATRFSRPAGAAVATLLAIAWSVPAYPAPMPSWYNLFLATAGVAALLRGLEDGRRRWLVLAGVAGGLSICIKIVGLYYVAAVLLYLVFRAHAQCRLEEGARARRAPEYAAAMSAALLLFVVGLGTLIRQRFAPAEGVHLVLPGAMLAALLAHQEWTRPAGPGRARFVALASFIAPFLLGVALPIALFVLPYVRSHAVGELMTGVFVLPTRRFGMATVPLMSLWTMITLLPLLTLVFAACRWPNLPTTPIVVVLVPVLAVLALFSGWNDAVYVGIWWSARNVIPVLVFVAVALLFQNTERSTDDEQLAARLMLIASVTALCSLVQFPFAVPVYFCYVAPLAVLLGLALWRRLQPMHAAVPVALLIFYLAFAVLRVDATPLYAMGKHFKPFPPSRRLDLARGGIEASIVQADEYEKVNLLLREHAFGGYTWASPDAPEIYFLTGLRNPTRTIFEFFDDTTRHEERVLASLEAHGVTAIVLNRAPEFSPGIAPAMLDELTRRYPYSAVARRFWVRWR